MSSWYDRSLATIGIEHERIGVDTALGRTHVLAAGPMDLPPVVLLHGTNAVGLAWKPQIRGLATRFRVYAPDIVGGPGRSAPTRLPEAGPAAGMWLSQVLDALGIGRAHVVGVSGGSWIAIKLGAYTPSRVIRAVLMSPAGLVPLRMPFRLARARGFLSLVDHMNSLTVRTPADVSRMLARTSGPGIVKDAETLELFAIVMRWFRNQPPPPTIPAAELRRITFPTLVMLGEHEVFFDPRRVIVAAQRLLPGLRAAEVVPGAGHALPSDRPDLVNARLVSFLSEARSV